MAANDLGPGEKAAVLLMILGEGLAGEILGRMPQEDRLRVIGAMRRMGRVDQATALRVADEFRALATGGQTKPAWDGGGLARKLLGKALPPAEAEALWRRGGFDVGAAFAFLAAAPTDAVVAVLKAERPQTVAVALAVMEARQAGDVVKALPAAQRVEALARVARLEAVDPEVLEELATGLREALGRRQSQTGAQLGGVGKAAAILNAMGTADGEGLLGGIGEKDPGLATELRQAMFTFRDLAKLDVRGMAALLRETPRDELIKALRGADEAEAAPIYAALSERAARALREDVQARGPVRVTEVREAQRAMARRAQDMVEAGKIVLLGFDEAV